MSKINFLFFAPLADEIFYQKLCEKLQNSGHQIKGYISDNKIKTPNNFPFAEWINCKLLYRQETVRKAIKIDFENLSFSEYSKSVKEGERYFLINLDRLSAIQNSTEYKIQHYRQLVSLYTTILKSWGITHVYFAGVPHFAVDLALYYVAKGMNIEVIFPSRTDYKNYFIMRNDLNAPPIKIGICDVDFEKNFNNSFYITYSKNLISQSIRFNSSFTQNKLFYCIRICVKFFKLSITAFLTKIYTKDSSLYCSSSQSALIFLLLSLKRYFQNKKLYGSYKSLSSKPELNLPYVYFALHFQPERSTLPEAGEYYDQISVIRHLSKVLPTGWKIYVKEHPRQFDSWPPDLRKLYSRSPDFYNEISEIQNVVLVLLDSDSEKLILSSKIAITMTGSTGWQAMLSGIPTITFGRTWYSEASPCRFIKNISDIGDAFKDLLTYTKNDVATGLQIFLKNLNHYVVLNYDNYDELSKNKNSNIDINQRVESVFKAIDIITARKLSQDDILEVK